jgi:multiple sugar transport system permease protein
LSPGVIWSQSASLASALMMLMYRYGYRDYNVPKASALSVMICIILVILSGIYMKATGSEEDA